MFIKHFEEKKYILGHGMLCHYKTEQPEMNSLVKKLVVERNCLVEIFSLDAGTVKSVMILKVA